MSFIEQLGVAIMAFVTLLLCVGVLVLQFINHINGLKEKYDSDRLAYKQRIESDRLAFEERNSTRYMLLHSPSRVQIERVLRSHTDPSDRQLAIETALASGDIITIGLVVRHAPEFRDRATMAYNDILFRQIADKDAVAMLQKFQGWESLNQPYGEWWRNWKPQLEAKVRAHEARMAIEKEREDLAAKLRKAEADGYKVCHKCDTIDPPRCHCGECISGDGECSNHNGECYHCAYPDDDDDDDDYWDYH